MDGIHTGLWDDDTGLWDIVCAYGGRCRFSVTTHHMHVGQPVLASVQVGLGPERRLSSLVTWEVKSDRDTVDFAQLTSHQRIHII